MSVEKSSYTIQKDKNYQMKYLSRSGLQVDSTATAGKTLYKWNSNHVAAVPREPLSIGINNVSSWVTASPNLFEYDGSSGNLIPGKILDIGSINLMQVEIIYRMHSKLKFEI
ncbi:hypothetical protein OKW96_17460 [Sphingobacterium sp. KU25419]|nr:hypothetical protein OKW96_17460 [Sphingobacterium sp. KU25419]